MARVSTRKVVVHTRGLYELIVRAVEEHFAEWDSHRKPRHYRTGELLPNRIRFNGSSTLRGRGHRST